MPLEHEIKAMVTNLTNRLNELQSKSHSDPAARHGTSDGEDDLGLSFINLAGSNNGAVLKAKLEESEKSSDDAEDEKVGTYVNSNYQAVNNSILLGGSCTSEDPGVHIVITDNVEKHDHQLLKKKKKEKEASKSDEQKHSEEGGEHGQVYSA